MALAMCIATIGFTSCGKDSEDLIVGKWECTKIEHELGSHISYAGEECEFDANLWMELGNIWSFDADGTATTTFYLDNPFKLWNINEDVLNIDKKTFTIEKLTSSEMILFMDRGNNQCSNPELHWNRFYFKKI
jgi:hypothetical protein